MNICNQWEKIWKTLPAGYVEDRLLLDIGVSPGIDLRLFLSFPDTKQTCRKCIFFWQNCWKPCFMYEYQFNLWPGPIWVRVDLLTPPPASYNWCMVRMPPSPLFWLWSAYLNWVRSNSSTVPELLSHGPVTVGWFSPIIIIINCNISLPSTTPTRKSKHACSYFRLSLHLFSVRSLGCLELFPTLIWGSLATRQLVQPPIWLSYHLIWVDSSLLVPLGFRLREYSPWAATRQLVQPHGRPSWEQSNLSRLEPDDLT